MKKRPPNILFLFSDQHRARALGCCGNAEVKTPHWDALAERVVRLMALEAGSGSILLLDHAGRAARCRPYRGCRTV